MFTSPSQLICSIFGVNIYYYGVIMAIAIFIGVLVSDWCANKFFGLKKDTIIDLAPYIIILGIVGARLYYCILNYSFYLRFPTEILAIRHGGISIHGAILGGLLGLYLYSRRHKLNLLKLCDASCIGLAIAQCIGRWGNFFNSEAFGLPTNLPWKLFIAPQYRPVPYQDYEYFHPTFLYESILDLFLFVLLFNIARRGFLKRDGNLALIYLIVYSIIRIFVETLRLDSVRYIMGMPFAIFVSIVIIVVSIFLIFINNKREK